MTRIDLLQAIERPEPRAARGPLGPLLVGALTLAVVATALYALAGRDIADREQRFAQVTAQTQASIAEVERLAPFVATQSEATARAGEVRMLARSRFGWERTLDDLTRVLPRGIGVSSIVGTRPDASATATADEPNAVTLTLKGCLPSQGRVPELLSRLETIRGVTDVTLNTSDAEQQEDASTCGADAPAFDVVMTFGESRNPDPAAAATPAPTPGAGA